MSEIHLNKEFYNKCLSSKIHELTPLGRKEAYMDKAKGELSDCQTKVLGNLMV